MESMCPWKKGVVIATIIAVIILLVCMSSGEAMTNYSYEGRFIKCAATQKIFLVQNGRKRDVSWPVYVKYGQPTPVIAPCNIVSPMPAGPDLV